MYPADLSSSGQDSDLFNYSVRAGVEYEPASPGKEILNAGKVCDSAPGAPAGEENSLRSPFWQREDPGQNQITKILHSHWVITACYCHRRGHIIVLSQIMPMFGWANSVPEPEKLQKLSFEGHVRIAQKDESVLGKCFTSASLGRQSCNQ